MDGLLNGETNKERLILDQRLLFSLSVCALNNTTGRQQIDKHGSMWLTVMVTCIPLNELNASHNERFQTSRAGDLHNKLVLNN
jgi:hypothetical protein